MATKSIRQEDINQAAWSACDTVRGAMDTARYKDHILALLFLKYISDVQRDYHDALNNTSDESPGQQTRQTVPFILPDHTSFYDLYDKRHNDHIGEFINAAFDAIEAANPSKLEGVFHHIDFSSRANLGQRDERNRRLKQLLQDFNIPSLDMRPSRISGDVIGNVYIYLIERFASSAGKKAGEFYTPHNVSKLVVRLCQIKDGARICDPACGSGGLLIEAARLIGNGSCSIYGMEVNGGTWALCRMNMLLNDVSSARIEWCNAITSPALVTDDGLMIFDNIVANPPFSLDKWGANYAKNDPYHRFWRGVPLQSKGDYAFISHMIETVTKKTGRVAVVVPHGVLFRQGEEERIRAQIIRDNLLDAVIGLPPKLFPTTAIAVAILIFDRSREMGGAKEDCTNVLFIDASQSYRRGKVQHTLMDAHIDTILDAYNQRNSIPHYAYVATYDDIKANHFNLSIPRYIDPFKEVPPMNTHAVQEEINRLEEDVSHLSQKITQIVAKMDPSYSSPSDVNDPSNGP